MLKLYTCSEKTSWHRNGSSNLKQGIGMCMHHDVLAGNVIHAQWFYIIDCSISIVLKLCSEKRA